MGFLPILAIAQEEATIEVAEPEYFRYGAGFQSTFPAWGLSGMMAVTDEVDLQLILGPFGGLSTYAARGLYTFRDNDFWDLYGYGMLGVWNHSTLRVRNETVLGFGVGGGIQYDWRVFNDELPPLFWNLELGFGRVNFDYYDFNSVMLGTGVHYRF